MRSFITCAIFSLLFACTPKDQYMPEDCFTKAQQDTVLYKIVRYSDKLPPQSNHEIKFDPKFDDYYRLVAADYKMRSCFKKDQDYYLLVTRAARSITPMREGIAIKMRYSESTGIEDYEEIFRTWKMPEQDLEKKYPELFTKMIRGESLEEFYPQNAGDQYIEFPDGRFYFDKKDRRWKDKVLDSLDAAGR